MAIDVHAHYVPLSILEAVEQNPSLYGSRLDGPPGPGGCLCYDYGLKLRPFYHELLDLEDRWKAMAGQGVDRQIVSVWADLFGYGMPAAAGANWHRMMNDRLGDAVQQNSQRLSMLASVPLQDAHLAATELEYGIKELGAVGGVVAASVDGANLGESPLDEFWAAAVELDVPIFIHPTQPVIPLRARNFGLSVIVQYLYDSTLSVGTLIFSGVLDRFPNLNILLSHGGGFVPYQIGRFDRIYRNMEPGEASAQAPSAYLNRFWYDTITHNSLALSFLRELVGHEKILLGTDYPFPVDDKDPMGTIGGAGFSAYEITQVTAGNAQQLFTKLPK
jgi:aminocarboxymuconate-semialdehyde decarboxylase